MSFRALALLVIASGCARPAPDSHVMQDFPTSSFYIGNSPLNGPLVPLPAPGPAEAAGIDEALLQQGAAKLAATSHVLSFLVLRHGKLVHEKYFNGGGATKSYNVHSASKSILSLLVGIAEGQGLVSLDARLDSLLGVNAYDYDVPANAGIKLRHLLTMQGGFSWSEDETEYEIDDQSNWVQAILDRPAATTPGTSFNYGTGSTHLVSAVLHKKTGDTGTFAKTQLFDKLGITTQRWGQDPTGINSGGCNLFLTPRALAKVAQLVLDKGRVGTDQVVPESWITAATQPKAEDDGYKYGYLFWLPYIDGHYLPKLWGHGGQYAVVLPHKDAVVVVTSATTFEHSELDMDAFVAQYVAPALD